MLVSVFIYVVVNAAIVVSISTLCSTTGRAAGASFAYALVNLTWTSLHISLASMVVGPNYNLVNPPPDPVFFLTRRLVPARAFHVLSNAVLGLGNSAASYAEVIDIRVAAANAQHFLLSQGNVVEVTFAGRAVPVVLQEWFVLVIFAVWLALSVMIAVYRFDQIDLT